MKTSEKQRMSREQLAEVQARHIARQLAFDDKTTAKFVDTYTRCQKEIWTLAPRNKDRRGTAKTDAETEKNNGRTIRTQPETARHKEKVQ